MTRRPKRRATKSASRVETRLPQDLRRRLEAARLDLLTLFRALDSLCIAAHLPPELHALFKLDADFAEALAVLDYPVAGYDLVKMQHDTLASLADVVSAKNDLLDTLDPHDRERLARRLPVVDATIDPREAYSQIPGREPRRG
jgi:hypothetical protein